MRRLSTSLLLILLVSLPFAVCAQVYQWTDAHGTVHYADTPPPQGTPYKSLKIIGSAPIETTATSSHVSAQPMPTSEPSADTQSKPAQPVRDTPANRKTLCKQLTANLALLKKDQPLVIKGKNGKNELMSKQARATQLKKSQKQYQSYCQS